MWIKKLLPLLLLVLIIPFVKGALPNATIAYNFSDASSPFVDYNKVYNMSVAGGTYLFQKTGLIGQSANSTTTSTYTSTSFTGIQTGDFTVELWFKPSNTNDQIVTASTSGYWGGIRLGNPANTMQLGVDGGGAGNIIGYGTAYNAPNVWHQYVYTRSGNAFSLYHNGTLINTSTYTGSFDRGNFRLGWTSSYSPVGGFYDEIRIWDGTALNSSKISKLWNNGDGLSYPFTTSPVVSNYSCSGTENCLVTCGTNFTSSTGTQNMNDYNISFVGSAATTYLLSNISNYTRINVGNCSIKLNGNKIY
jgi:hypothetical protein